VVAVDLPSGLDATTGDIGDPCVTADLTLTFGSIKRGHLVARGTCGTIVVLDIGLGTAIPNDTSGRLVDEHWAAVRLPRWDVVAILGRRGLLVMVGGEPVMSGAAVLAARAAARSGIGMVKLVVSRDSLPIVQETEPYALAAAWPEDAAAVERDIVSWADAVVIGPGLGRGDESRAVLERVLQTWEDVTLLDADAITLFEGQAERLRDLLANRPCLLTPHVVELSRIAGAPPEAVLVNRFEIGATVAAQLGATVLLKGVPTIVSDHSGDSMISATGTPALATAGSGDVLSGIAGTLMAQIGDPMGAGALAAFVHGRAAERVPSVSGARGITLDDIVGELRNVWDFDTSPTRYPVLAELPAIAP
jgi:NAD(P)H-hydrate epimerase